jgi:hypothetical protein
VGVVQQQFPWHQGIELTSMNERFVSCRERGKDGRMRFEEEEGGWRRMCWELIGSLQTGSFQNVFVAPQML